MIDGDYARLRDLIGSTADASGWTPSLPDGTCGRLIPADRHTGISPGIVLVVPEPDRQGSKRFLLVACLDLSTPIELQGPDFYVTTYTAGSATNRSLWTLHGRGGPYGYADARQAVCHAEVCIANGQQPLPDGPSYRRLWHSLRTTPSSLPGVLLRPGRGQRWQRWCAADTRRHFLA